MTTSNEHNNAPAVPSVQQGWKLVMVEDGAPANEPDWDEVKRQAEVSTGIPINQPTYSIIIREIRRWLIQRDTAVPSKPAVPMSESQRTDMICAVAAICTGTSSRTVAATAIEWVERYYGITAPAAPSQPAVPQGEPVAWLDLSKMSASAMVYATGWKSNDKQSPLYTAAAIAPAVNNWQSIKLVPPVPSKVIRSGLNALGHLFDTAPISDGQRAHWLTWSKDVRAMLTREEDATPATAPAQEVGLTASQFDLICQAIDKADTVTMEGDYMLDSDDCIAVVRVMQVLFDVAALRAKGGK